MISRLRGTVLALDEDRVEVETPGGVVYEVEVPLTVFQRLPPQGDPIELRTEQVVTDKSIALYGFISGKEKVLFQRLRTVSGVGAKVALGILSTLAADRLARAIVEKDTTALRQAPKVGKKLAETIAIELSDKVDDLVEVVPSEEEAGAVHTAVQALVSLGYSFGDAEKAVRSVLQEGAADDTQELIRRALAG